jgi:hypothetical protein
VAPDRQIESIGQESTGSNHNDWANHPTVATWHNNLGMVLQALGELEGARAQYEQALVIGEAARGPDDRTVATIRGNLNSVLPNPPTGDS